LLGRFLAVRNGDLPISKTVSTMNGPVLPPDPFDQSLERRWSSRRFPYGYLVTT
jgi:hypothetical protein